MRQWIIIGAIILVLLGSYLWNRNRGEQGEVTLPSPEEIITQEGGKVVKKSGDTVQELSSEEVEAREKEINEKVATITPLTLKPVQGQSGSGISSSAFDNGTYYQKITITNVQPLQKGSFYEGWLEKQDGSRISIGRVGMSGTQGELFYSVKDDRRDYTKVVISREVEDGNPALGEVVLEGTQG